MPIEGIRNFVAVSPQCATGGQPSEQQLREIADAGFEVVVNLGLLDPRYCLPDEAGLAAALGLRYHHIPVDFTAPRADDFVRFCEALDQSRGRKVFVHCAANYRVASFVALYGQARLGWSDEQADAHIARVWNPNPTWQAFLEEMRRALKQESGA